MNDGPPTPEELPFDDDVVSTCDWGHCSGATQAVRWNDTGEGIATWLSVCGRHRTKSSVPIEKLRPRFGPGSPGLRMVPQ